MKRFLVAIVGASLLACTSIETATVASNEVVTAEGDAVALIQTTSIGWTLFFHSVNIINSDLDHVVNKLMMKEAKSLGANRVQLLNAGTSPRGGIFGLPSLIMGFPVSSAAGIAVK